ncbi:hypothetical protein [Aureimonas leprariae]|nr:hypothetical protein [Aureimonas leprariae]
MTALDYLFGSAPLGLSNRGGDLDVNDDRVLHVHRIVGAVGEDGRAA